MSTYRLNGGGSRGRRWDRIETDLDCCLYCSIVQLITMITMGIPSSQAADPIRYSLAQNNTGYGDC